MGWNHYNLLGGYGGFWWLNFLGVIIYATIAFAIVYGIIKMAKTSNRKVENDEPLNILKIRYAKGEIDFEDFEKRKRELGYK